MKKYLFFILAGVLAITSCNKEIQTETVEPEDGPQAQTDLVPMTFKASLEDLGTKSDIADDFILWESSDKIAIFDGTDTFKEFTVSVLSPSGKGAEFSGSAASASSYVAVAPFSAASTIKADLQRFSITVHSSQTIIGSHSVDPESLVSTAVATGTSDLAFENQFALLKVKLEKNGIVAVTVKGNNGESISGTNHFYYGGEGSPRVDLSNAGGKQVTLTYKATADATPSAFPAGEYYITIWPTEFTGGYSVILTDEDGGKSIKTNSNPQTIARNGGQDLSTVDDFTFCPAVITTASQLKMWRRLASAGVYAEGDEVKLGADINLGGYAWTPVPEFLGIFDGQGHKIYNFTINSDAQKVGFIADLGNGSAAAVLKNVIFGSSDGTTADGSSSIKISTTSSGWAYAGLVAYVRHKASIQGVTNFVPVTGLADMTVKHRIAGIAGMIGNDVTISDCHNWADIYDRSACDTGEGSSIAGVVGGWGGSNSELIGCTNHGQVYNYCTGVPYVAGVIGYTMGEGMHIQDCHNLANGSKEISNEAVSTRDTDKFGSINWSILTGGIVGVVGKNVTINKCTNTMKVYGKSTSTSNCRACIGGIAGGCIRNGSSIKGCSSSADDTRPFGDLNTDITAGGIIGFVGNSSDMIITKADDGTWTTNGTRIHQNNVNNNHALYFGGIVGLLNSKNAVVSYCRNTGKVDSRGNKADKGTFCGGGICGSAIGTITNCINDGVIYNTTAGDGDGVKYYSGGICGDTDAPKEISYCTNNGPVSVYSSNGSTATGGIISQLKPGSTVFKFNTNTGLITTGNLNSYPGTPKRNIQNIEVSLGALIGKIVPATAEATICEGCVVACDVLNAQTYDKWGYCGLVAGEVYSKDSWPYKVTVGSSANPLMIVNTTKVATGDNGNPATETVLDNITTVAIANKYVMGKKNTLYSSTDGSNDATKMELNLSVVTSAQAGIE